MQRRFRITVDGRAYEVTVEEIVNEAPAPPASAASAALAVAAHALAVAAAAPAAAPIAKPAPGDEVAPLAGVVESIDVTVGDMIAAGARIATIEAMKMKTEVFARGAGRVVAIAVKPGDSVDAGERLLRLA